METHILKHSFTDFIQFKSYYVVWKPYEVTEAKDGKYRFKSYYVVWKLLCHSVSDTVRESLNRTM